MILVSIWSAKGEERVRKDQKVVETMGNKRNLCPYITRAQF
jgi:hypothetical protein